eukprot:m.436807 g.436807  ORF g.436807 m.436807 type:complete len:264 (-) comp18016_c0_seq1:143-934(-)
MSDFDRPLDEIIKESKKKPAASGKADKKGGKAVKTVSGKAALKISQSNVLKNKKKIVEEENVKRSRSNRQKQIADRRGLKLTQSPKAPPKKSQSTTKVPAPNRNDKVKKNTRSTQKAAEGGKGAARTPSRSSSGGSKPSGAKPARKSSGGTPRRTASGSGAAAAPAASAKRAQGRQAGKPPQPTTRTIQITVENPKAIAIANAKKLLKQVGKRGANAAGKVSQRKTVGGASRRVLKPEQAAARPRTGRKALEPATSRRGGRRN